jgi:hypothetical protein
MVLELGLHVRPLQAFDSFVFKILCSVEAGSIDHDDEFVLDLVSRLAVQRRYPLLRVAHKLVPEHRAVRLHE